MERIIEHEWDDDRWRESSKTVIKFKIPSSNTVEQGRIRVCLECNKEFSSGKALGGHMRVHFQPGNKNPNSLKPAKDFNNNNNSHNNLKPYYLNSVNNEGKPTCSQCGKTFPSMKSLFGHMRCHPERLWRGILPPPPNRRTGGGDDVVDLTKYLRRWPVTERRGRRAVKAADDADDVVLLEAVEDLLSLANVNAGDSVTESGVTNRQLKPENSPSVSRPDTEFVIGKGKAVMVEELELEDDENIMMKNINISVNSSHKIKRRKKMKLMMELEQQQQQPDIITKCKYKCTTCNKGFATHQALGGHRSSHNKSRFIITDHHQIEEHDFVMNQSSENNLEKEIESAGGHQCKICDKVFATGQALGGHKRCHWGGGVTEAVQAPSSHITSAGEAGSQTESGRKVLEFDLNEIPMMKMEEDESANVNGNGYASSSYNSNMG